MYSKEYYQKNKEKIAASNKRWLAKHKDWWKNYCRNWMSNHPKVGIRNQKNFIILHPLYPTWQMMKQRCYNPNHDAFKRYGQRGITVCREWDDYQTFENWALINKWQKGSKWT